MFVTYVGYLVVARRKREGASAKEVVPEELWARMSPLPPASSSLSAPEFHTRCYPRRL